MLCLSERNRLIIYFIFFLFLYHIFNVLKTMSDWILNAYFDQQLTRYENIVMKYVLIVVHHIVHIQNHFPVWLVSPHPTAQLQSNMNGKTKIISIMLTNGTTKENFQSITVTAVPQPANEGHYLSGENVVCDLVACLWFLIKSTRKPGRRKNSAAIVSVLVLNLLLDNCLSVLHM